MKVFGDLRETADNPRTHFFDQVFENQMNQAVIEAVEGYEKMRFRDVLKSGFFEFQNSKDDYKLMVGQDGMCKSLVLKYIEYQLLILYPIAPHFSEILYKDILLSLVEDKY